jgi:hypothetical protein
VTARGQDGWFDNFLSRVLRLWASGAVMLAAGVPEALLFIVLAVVRRRSWTLALAGIACLVMPFLNIKDGAVAWDPTYVGIIAAIVGSFRCFAATRTSTS